MNVADDMFCWACKWELGLLAEIIGPEAVAPCANTAVNPLERS